MTEKRKEFFARMTENEKLLLASEDFIVSEIMEIISETPLNEQDKLIAELRYVRCHTIEKISEIIQIDKKTTHKKIKIISNKLKTTFSRMF